MKDIILKKDFYFESVDDSKSILVRYLNIRLYKNFYVKHQKFEEAAKLRDEEKIFISTYNLDELFEMNRIVKSGSHYFKEDVEKIAENNLILMKEEFISFYEILKTLTPDDLNDLISCKKKSDWNSHKREREIFSKYFDSIVCSQIETITYTHDDIIRFIRDERIKKILNN